MPDRTDIISWLHIGDLHMTGAGEQNHRELLRIVDLVQGLAQGSPVFVVLPGHNADDGSAEQFALVRDAVAGLNLPVHILPGHHDFKPDTLDAFPDVSWQERLPKSTVLRGHRRQFPGVVSGGSGGPDFRLGDAQLDWVEHELDRAEAARQGAVVFRHIYPPDLRERGVLGTRIRPNGRRW